MVSEKDYKYSIKRHSDVIEQNMTSYKVLNRSRFLFEEDLIWAEVELASLVSKSKFLVIGGAGSIGQAVTREIFTRQPKLLHVVDLSENNLVELVRSLRSTAGYFDGEFQTFCLDSGSREFDALMEASLGYDYVLNLSALKHVRSERDPFTLMRLLKTNIFNTLSSLQWAKRNNVRKYFTVSTDKAANPANLMGASKRIMEIILMQESQEICVSTARFANVAFSDGSLLDGFNKRFLKHQPITAPKDIKRFFFTEREAGVLCLMSTILGLNREIFFPKENIEMHLTSFTDIAFNFIQDKGFTPHICESESEARNKAHDLISNNKWPLYFFNTDTTGEKNFEEFYTITEKLDMDRYNSIGIIKTDLIDNYLQIEKFIETYEEILNSRVWKKEKIVDAMKIVIPDLNHVELGKNLDEKM